MVLRPTGRSWEILLIERRFPPYAGMWALPGGFVDRREDALTAAKRELNEETGLKALRLREFGSFSAPDRDPRGRTVTIAFYAVLKRNGVRKVTAGDDAGRARWFRKSALPRLAFDHKEMIAKGLRAFRRDMLSGER